MACCTWIYNLTCFVPAFWSYLFKRPYSFVTISIPGLVRGEPGGGHFQVPEARDVLDSLVQDRTRPFEVEVYISDVAGGTSLWHRERLGSTYAPSPHQSGDGRRGRIDMVQPMIWMGGTKNGGRMISTDRTVHENLIIRDTLCALRVPTQPCRPVNICPCYYPSRLHLPSS